MNEVDGGKICHFRKKAKLTQQEIGEKLNVTKAMVSFWETGRNSVDPQYHDRLCKILNVNFEDIYPEANNNFDSYRLKLTDVVMDSPEFDDATKVKIIKLLKGICK